jgi:hypothetical protein
MAFDRYDDGVDGPGEAKPERHLRDGGQDADAAAGRTEPAEPRSRQEYYEVLRAADGRPVQASDDRRASAEARPDARADARTDGTAEARTDASADARTDRSGWDAAVLE